MAEQSIQTEQTRMDLPSLTPEKAEGEVNVFRPDDIPDRQKELIRRHQAWMGSIRKEYPLPSVPYRIGIYIRYFNQTKYKDYLEYHKKEFTDTISLCPRWTLVDFYIDQGQSAPRMENAPELCRLLNDCLSGKVDLIITQKISNMSRKARDLALTARILAAHGIGIYFISEDIFTTASYYQPDMRDTGFLPEGFDFPQEEIPEGLPGGIHVE